MCTTSRGSKTKCMVTLTILVGEITLISHGVTEGITSGDNKHHLDLEVKMLNTTNLNSIKIRVHLQGFL